MAVVAPGDSLQVILVILLGGPEGRSGYNFRDDRPAPLPRSIHPRLHLLRDLTLFVVVKENRGTVLRPHVVALAILGGGIVQTEVMLENLLVADFGGIELDLQRLGVAGASGLDRLVGGIRCGSTRVSDGRVDDSGKLADQLLDSPEASAGKSRSFCGHFFTPSKRTLYWP